MVDDEPYITDLLGAALRFEGFSVEVASTGTEAIAMAQRGRHDLVLLDVMLPDVSGTEVCRRLRAEGIQTPVLFLTALRRTSGLVGADQARLVFADLEMDDDTHEVWRQGTLIDLTATEFNLLRFLLENSRRVLSKSDIVDNVWTYEFDGDPNIVETYISYLRKKIDSFDPPLIHTIRGVGYSLRVARDREADGV